MPLLHLSEPGFISENGGLNEMMEKSRALSLARVLSMEGEKRAWITFLGGRKVLVLREHCSWARSVLAHSRSAPDGYSARGQMVSYGSMKCPSI